MRSMNKKNMQQRLVMQELKIIKSKQEQEQYHRCSNQINTVRIVWRQTNIIIKKIDMIKRMKSSHTVVVTIKFKNYQILENFRRTINISEIPGKKQQRKWEDLKIMISINRVHLRSKRENMKAIPFFKVSKIIHN